VGQPLTPSCSQSLRGWMIVEAGHSICLIDAGRRLMEIARLDGTPHDAHTRA
jgi:hypothetical protein